MFMLWSSILYYFVQFDDHVAFTFARKSHKSRKIIAVIKKLSVTRAELNEIVQY